MVVSNRTLIDKGQEIATSKEKLPCLVSKILSALLYAKSEMETDLKRSSHAHGELIPPSDCVLFY